MKRLSNPAPVAVLVGLTHVSVGPIGDGFAAFAWSPATAGPVPLCSIRPYESAVDVARAYAAAGLDRVLDLPDGLGEVEGRALVHVDRRGDLLEVLSESSSGGSFASLRTYPLDQPKRAVLFALEVLGIYTNGKGQPSRLGRVEV